MVVWQCKSVQALPLCCGVRDAKPRALVCPGGEKWVVVAGVPCPSRPLCVTDRKLSPVRLKTPPEYPCLPPTHTSWGRRGMDGVTLHTHQGYVPCTGASPRWAICPSVPVGWGRSAKGPGSSTPGARQEPGLGENSHQLLPSPLAMLAALRKEITQPQMRKVHEQALSATRTVR